MGHVFGFIESLAPFSWVLRFFQVALIFGVFGEQCPKLSKGREVTWDKFLVS